MKSIGLLSNTGARATISEYGAHLLKWQSSDGRERIFLSKDAVFEPGKAIRGGVPIIFPQFNEFGSGQRHGFARHVTWEFIEVGSQQVRLLLASSDLTQNVWPFDFVAEYTVSVADDQLKMQLSIENTDSKAFQFTAALHTYLAVENFQQASVSGFRGAQFWDNDGSNFSQRSNFEEESLIFDGAIDRVFFDVKRPVVLRDQGSDLEISMAGFSDVVVWNPGELGARALTDLADDEHNLMVCIEAAAIDQPIELAPGEKWQGGQTLKRK